MNYSRTVELAHKMMLLKGFLVVNLLYFSASYIDNHIFLNLQGHKHQYMEAKACELT